MRPNGRSTRRPIAALAVALSLTLCAGAARAAVAVAERALPAGANAIRVHGGHLFVATDAGLEIFDLSDPSAPERVGGVPTPSPVANLRIQGGLAYLACHGGLRIVDVSDPAAPLARGSLDTPAHTFDLELAGDGVHAYLATVGVLRIADVSDPDEPAEIDALEPLNLARLARIGTLLFGIRYIPGPFQLSGASVFDVSDPTAPLALPPIPPLPPGPGGDPESLGMSVDGDRLWLHEATEFGENVLRVFEVDAAPVLLATDYLGIEGGFHIWAMQITGGWMHAVGSNSGFPITRWDVSEIGASDLVAKIGLTAFEPGAQIDALGDMVYVANADRLRVVDFAKGEAPELLDQIGLATPEDIDVVDGLAYVASGAGGIYVVDVSDPAQLVELGRRDFSNPRYAHEIAAAPPIALVGDLVGFRVASVANPANPYILADPLVAARSVEIDGSVGYVAAYDAGLQTWNLSEPTQPALLDSVPGLEWIDLTLSNGLAYAVGVDPLTEGFAFSIVDVHDPAATADLGRVAIDGDVGEVDDVSVAVAGDVAYVLLDEQVVVVEVSNPELPLALGSFRVCWPGRRIETQGVRLFVVTGCGLVVYDLADPLEPFELAIVGEGLDSRAVDVVGRIAHLGQAGLLATHDLGATLAPEPAALAAAGATVGALAWWARRRAQLRRRAPMSDTPAPTSSAVDGSGTRRSA